MRVGVRVEREGEVRMYVCELNLGGGGYVHVDSVEDDEWGVGVRGCGDWGGGLGDGDWGGD